MNQPVINFHLTEYCNYACQFCFAKYGLEEQFNSELHHDVGKIRLLLTELWSHFAGPSGARINFVGGEPLLVNNFGKIIELAVEQGFEVSLVTNASALGERFLSAYASKLSMIGVSVDSFDDATNRTIGRITRGSKLLDRARLLTVVERARTLNPEILIKLNTVVCSANYAENMRDGVNSLSPDKWKVFRVLPEGDKRNLLISDEEFAQFVARHRGQTNTVMFVEDNEAMTESYIMIDPLGRFMQNSGPKGSRVYSTPILITGAAQAFSKISFRQDKYEDRYIPLQMIDPIEIRVPKTKDYGYDCAA